MLLMHCLCISRFSCGRALPSESSTLGARCWKNWPLPLWEYIVYMRICQNKWRIWKSDIWENVRRRKEVKVGKALPTLNDQDLLSHKTPTLHFWLVHPQRPLHFLCLWIRMYNRVLHVMARYCHQACCIIGYFISLQAIAWYCKVSHGIAQCCMVLSGHWVGCIIGRQFRQLALPQAGKQKTRPPLHSRVTSPALT